MPKYVFKSICNSDLVARCNKDRFVTVDAPSETRARHLAMVARWGEPRGIYWPLYRGLGLELISTDNEGSQDAQR